MQKKKQRLQEIAELVDTFCKKYLTDELAACALKLCETLGRKRKLDITRGKKEIWAAAIVYAIARINFLFDKANPCFLTAETICDFFGTKKTIVSQKATVIEESCNLGLGEPGYCTREIEETFSFVQLPNGLILPGGMIEFEAADEEESEEIEKFLAEMLRQEKEALRAKEERRAEINRDIAEKKRKKQEAIQPSLFGD